MPTVRPDRLSRRPQGTADLAVCVLVVTLAPCSVGCWPCPSTSTSSEAIHHRPRVQNSRPKRSIHPSTPGLARTQPPSQVHHRTSHLPSLVTSRARFDPGLTWSELNPCPSPVQPPRPTSVPSAHSTSSSPPLPTSSSAPSEVSLSDLDPGSIQIESCSRGAGDLFCEFSVTTCLSG